MILNSFQGFHGFANPKNDNAAKKNSAAISPQEYNATYLKSNYFNKTPYPNAERPALPVQGSDKWGWSCAGKYNDAPIPHTAYNTTYLTNPTYTVKTPVPKLYTMQDGLNEVKTASDSFTNDNTMELVSVLAQTDAATWQPILDQLTQLQLIEQQRPLNEREIALKT